MNYDRKLQHRANDNKEQRRRRRRRRRWRRRRRSHKLRSRSYLGARISRSDRRLCKKTGSQPKETVLRGSQRMNVPSHKLVLHRKENVYSVSWLGARTAATHTPLHRMSRLSAPARIRAARRCAAGSPTDSSLMEPVNTVRGTLCFPNEIPKIYFRNSPPPPPPPSLPASPPSSFILDEIFRLALITPNLRNDRYLLLHCRFCYCSAQPPRKRIRDGVASLCD